MIRNYLVRRIRERFNDLGRGEQPIEPSDTALLPPGGVAWRVHADVTTMMVGGVAALLVEMLHPQALGGVWDHSRVGDDQLGRLRRTARFIAVTTYGERGLAEAAIERVRSIHRRVLGTLPDGTPYQADDPELLAWIHVVGARFFLAAWRRYGEPDMSRADQNRYFAEVATVAEALGADPVPRSLAEAEALFDGFRPMLRADARSLAFRDLVLKAPAGRASEAPLQAIVMAAAVELMPAWARAMHDLPDPRLTRPLIRLSTRSVAGTLRWAFAPVRRVRQSLG